MVYGSGFEGRAFVSPSQYKNGDLSLTILKVQHSDKGIYTHRNKELGEPEAIVLSIEPPECAAVEQSTFLCLETIRRAVEHYGRCRTLTNISPINRSHQIDCPSAPHLGNGQILTRHPT